MTDKEKRLNRLYPGSVIRKKLKTFEDDAKELSELLGISEAKAELILDIIEADPRLTVEELAMLSINDLNLLLEANNIVLNNVEKTGNASELGIISAEEAYQLALTESGLDGLSVVRLKVTKYALFKRKPRSYILLVWSGFLCDFQ